MSFTNWLRAFRALGRPGITPSSPPRRCPRAGARFRHRPRLERLEDRVTPALVLDLNGADLGVDFATTYVQGQSPVAAVDSARLSLTDTQGNPMIVAPSGAGNGIDDDGNGMTDEPNEAGPTMSLIMHASPQEVLGQGQLSFSYPGVTGSASSGFFGFPGTNIGAVYDQNVGALQSGTLYFFGTDTVANYEAVLRTLTFRTSPQSPTSLSGTFVIGSSLGAQSQVTISPGNAVPASTGLDPASKPEGSADFTLTVAGTDFVGDSVVLWNGAALPTTFVSDTQLQATVPAAYLTEEGGALVTVSNPAPGGGTSNPLPFLINDAALNVAPPSFSATEGVSFSGPVATFTDPGGDEAINDPGTEYTATINWGEAGGTDEAATVTHLKAGGFAVSGSHTYADEGPHNVTVWVTHGATVTVSLDAATGTYTFPPGLPLLYTSSAAVTVADGAPVVNAGSGATLDEGQTFARSGSFSDPSADTWTATVNYGDGSGDQPLTLNADKTFALSHSYPTAGSYTLTVKVRDDEGAIGSSTLTITVNATTPRLAPAPAPAPARAIAASLVTRRHKLKKTLFVHIVFADTGALKTEVRSPFQNPAFQAIRAVAVDTDGDGVPDAVRVSARKGKKTVTFTLAV